LRRKIPIAEGEADQFYRLAPDGRDLVCLIGEHVKRYPLPDGEPVVSPTVAGVTALAVDRRNNRVLLGTEKGSLTVLDIASLKEIGQQKVTTGEIIEIYPTTDRSQVFVVSKLPEQFRPRYHKISFAVEGKIEVEDFKTDKGYIVADTSGETLWWVETEREQWQASPMRPGRIPENGPVEGSITIRSFRSKRDATSPVAICARRGYLLARKGESFVYFDLKSGLPLFELNNRPNGPLLYEIADLRGVAHIPPRLGTQPLFDDIEELSFDGKSAETLLPLAGFVTKLRQRNDSVWFALQTRSRDEDCEPLLPICRWLLALRQAESDLKAGKPADAVALLQKTLREVIAAKPEKEMDAMNDWTKVDVATLASHYRPVVERELWLTLAKAFDRANDPTRAEAAARKALVLEPREWRAYAQLLSIKLTASEKEFDDIVAEAQKRLRVEWLTDDGPPPSLRRRSDRFGPKRGTPVEDPHEFFDEVGLQKSRERLLELDRPLR
jgi:hypothetical protein